MLLGNPGRALRLLGAALAVTAAAACSSSTPGPGPAPTAITITAVSPATGSTFGGTAFTVTGTGFTSGATVLVGGTAATDVVVASPTSITAKTPAHVAGAGDVKVSVGAVNGSLASAFTFVTPSVGPNTAPTVGALSVTAPRQNQPRTLATIGDRMTLTVTINDAETPLSELSLTWTALPNIGTFSGSGASVQWTAPASTTSPQVVVLMLTVLEHYQEPDANGLPIQREHRVQRTAMVKVHDTRKEVTDMAVDFLDRFSNSSITSPETVLHNFSRTCDGGDGYQSEYNDVVVNREDYFVIGHDIATPTVFEYNFSSRQACSRKSSTAGDVCVEVPIQWTDRYLPTNEVNSKFGIDFVTGVYEEDQWRLCHSRWTANLTLTGKPVQMDFDRRRIIKGPLPR